MSKKVKKIEKELKYAEFIAPSFFCPKKYTTIVAPRQTGKTFGGIVWISLKLLETPRSKGAWVDMSHKNIESYIKMFFPAILGEIFSLCKIDLQAGSVTFPNGSILKFLSATNPDAGRGHSYDYMVINEAGFVLSDNSYFDYILNPMLRKGQCKIIGTPNGQNFFYKMFSEFPINDPENWASFRWTAYETEMWSKKQLDSIKANSPENSFAQEYMCEFLSSSTTSVIKGFFPLITEDKKQQPYTKEHDLLKKEISEFQGFYFISIDGGAKSSFSAAVLGFKNTNTNRYFLLKEFFVDRSQENDDPILVLCRKILDFCTFHSINEFRICGDPALFVNGDNTTIEKQMKTKMSLLEKLKNSTIPKLRDMYQHRLTARIGVLNREIHAVRGDGMPAMIVVKGHNLLQNPSEYNNFGCYMLTQGLFNGEYKYETFIDRHGNIIIKRELEQNHPIVDICDSLTYFLLDDKPLAPNEDSSNEYYPIF